jgi:hypothetical protein
MPRVEFVCPVYGIRHGRGVKDHGRNAEHL